MDPDLAGLGEEGAIHRRRRGAGGLKQGQGGEKNNRSHGSPVGVSNAPEPRQLLLQLFKSIAWGNQKILNDSCLIDHAQLTPGPLLDIPRQASDPQAAVDALSR